MFTPRFIRGCLAILASVVGAAVACGQTKTNDPARTYRSFALVREGRVAEGRALFEAKDRVGCVNCHTTDGRGGKAGPDLAAVGDALGRAEIIEAILNPSATIAIGYGAVTVETSSGQSHVGVIKESDDRQVGLVGADGLLVRIPREDVKSQTPLPVSLMPPMLYAALSVQEFTDLVAYLTSLRQPANSLSLQVGMPEEISALERPLELRPVYGEALRFSSAAVRQPGDQRTGLIWYGQEPGTLHYLAALQAGQIWRIDARRDGGHVKALFLDLTAEIYSRRGPNGLLHVTFHPNFRENRKYYLAHQVFEGGKIFTTVVERRVAENRLTDSGEPSRQLLKIATVTENHTGACLAFGPDGFLYFSMGDTGPQRDPNGHAQNLGLLLGKILRLDVDHRDPGLEYAIPGDNPLRDQAGARAEIFAWGLREPWRFSFDAATGDLWVGDVGQDRVEEVSIVRRGENLGWNVYEGFEAFSNRHRAPGQSYVSPVMAYKRKYGNSVTGGYVYRGDRQSSFYGVYVFGDYTSKRIWGLVQQDRHLTALRQLAVAPESLASFGTDEAGRIYAVGYEGMVYELMFAGATFPRQDPGPAGSPKVSRSNHGKN
ncbi:MAG: PQQ-dependent sugar dehydrogenase [Verrucomicrobia bacterium]|nr:PQQ-dependent sugar dehydrogenase [Verrucomicrobiota bacterium]